MSDSSAPQSTEKSNLAHVEYARHPTYHNAPAPTNHILNESFDVVPVIDPAVAAAAKEAGIDINVPNPLEVVDSNQWTPIKNWLREYFGEFFGTLVLVVFGDGVVAQKVLSAGAAADYVNISLAWGFAVMFGWLVAVAAGAGAHLNPAVTIGFTLFRGFPKKKVPGYIFSQLLGGFLGALIVYATYFEAFQFVDPHHTVTGPTATAGVFCTFPAGAFLNTKGQFVSEFVASAFLMICILSLIDLNQPSFFPLGLAFAIVVLGSSLGWQTGYAMNMARDFAPRVAAVAVGYGNEMFSAFNGYSWIPIVAPVIGVVFGCILYDGMIYQGTDSPMNQKYFGFEWFVDRKSYNRKRGLQADLDQLKLNVDGDEV